ncbi:MAG TPA: excinuclease ABC subunit UvrA [Armatimonadota bacterium]|jgi:excinuclease ABC subunit A
MRSAISIRGAKEHNLKNVDIDIPRDQLVVVTGISGSGKSSLAFDTLYAEGQRRFLESLSAWAKRHVSQLRKPNVDTVYGLSPVVSIEQKTVGRNPRSTVGTMTDVQDYLRILYATVGVSHCPFCEREIAVSTPARLVEHLLSLPEGTTVELSAPIFKIYGEDFAYLFGEVRTKGCRRVRVDGVVNDLSEELELDETRDYRLEAVVDKIVVRKGIHKQVLAAVQSALSLGERYLRVDVLNPEVVGEAALRAFYEAFACPEHQITTGELQSFYFSFNEPDGACPTCSGLGTYLKAHPDLLVPDRARSILGGAFIPEAFRFDKNTWGGRMMYSLSQHYGFSLDVPYSELPEEVVQLLLYGTQGERIALLQPPGGQSDRHIGKPFRWDGIINQIERSYKHYRKQQVTHTNMEHYLRRVMVEHVCPDCGGTKLMRQRLLVTVKGLNLHEMGEMNLEELREFLRDLPLPEKHRQVGQQILTEITARIDLLLGIGLTYLNLNRRATTLSGGESQRIRLSTQIGSGLMGMLYVLDEPSIGLHPRDNVKLIGTLKKLRDIGNSVIVVEHDEETIRAADHIIEVGPEPGERGGEIVAQGTLKQILDNSRSLTGQFLSGRRRIEIPPERRHANGHRLRIVGARQNNLRDINVEFPLGLLICVTGVSGSGKSTLVNDILFKKLYSVFYDSRTLSGDHDCLEGVGSLTDVVNIDQSAIGRSPRSNPATYIGVYDAIRTLFASTEESKRRGYTASRFSFNVKGGRCEECAGEGTVTTSLHFLPDVEVECQACHGARFNQDTLEVTYNGLNIAEVLDLPIEAGVHFFQGIPVIARKLGVLDELGLGYVRIGQSSSTLSGGESQRIKLARELGKLKRGSHTLYILDEPTTGLHLADIQRLLDCLNRLVDAGNTVVVIEHHLDVVKTADHLIDLGPDGGHAGGEVVVTGTPEQVAAHEGSYTGRYLSAVLG